jgi:prolyl oligopeptidase
MSIVAPPPFSAVEPVTEVLHGVPVTDPYRWLEDQNSPETRAWIKEQTRYARAYLDKVPGRDLIRNRVRELLDVETYDSFLKIGNRYFFRKRLAGQEQSSIYMREGSHGEDQILVDPASRGTGDYTAVKPMRVSPEGSLLLYEVKHGGERTAVFEILDVARRKRFPDSLSHGYLRGFAFAPDAKSFYYVHEAAQLEGSPRWAAYRHVLGTDSGRDQQIFCAGEGSKLRLVLISGRRTLGFLIYRFSDKTLIDFYIWPMESTGSVVSVLHRADYSFAPRLLPGRILAAVGHQAVNRRIVEVQPRKNLDPLYFDLIPERDGPIHNWAITANHIVASYVRGTRSQIAVFDHFGKRVGEIPLEDSDTVRIVASSHDDDELLLERESFTRPIEIVRVDLASGAISTWARRSLPFDPSGYSTIEVNFPSTDGTVIPMSVLGRHNLLLKGDHPAIMTSYGGFGICSTPQFSVSVAFLLERGCLFALPNIRGGSEFGSAWHDAAKRRNRQAAYDDFLSATEWLIHTGRTSPEKLAIFGGSNSGLLVAAALTQRPDLFRSVVCVAPMLDMLRYHLFDNACVWKEEFGTSEDADDFAALAKYSPYHQVRPGIAYPATMIISGDADQNCNPLHARKMIARLQAANSSDHPIILDYSRFRGHSPVLPLRTRINALTDRIAFLCQELGLPPKKEASIP